MCRASGCGAGVIARRTFRLAICTFLHVDSTNHLAEGDLNRKAFSTSLESLARTSNPEGRGRGGRSNPHLSCDVVLLPPES